MSQDQEKHENVVNLAEARRRQRTVHRAGAQGKAHKATADKKPGSGGKWRQIFGYLQLILFLAVVAYMMQLCGQG